MLEDRGALPREDGDPLREHQAMHEENFLSSWLRENVERKAEREEGKSGKREVANSPISEMESVGGFFWCFRCVCLLCLRLCLL